MTIQEVNRVQKKSHDELQEYLQFRRRGSIVKAKKGKGSYKRNQKHRSFPYAPIAQ